MDTHRKGARWLGLALGLALGAAVPARAQRTARADSLVRLLHSPDAGKRADALDSLRKIPGGLDRPGVPEYLLALLKQENERILAPLIASKGAEGIGEGEGEAFSFLQDDCSRHCPAQPFVDFLIADERRHVPGARHEDIRILGWLALPTSHFSSEQRARMRRVVIQAAIDSGSFIVRQYGLEGLDTIIKADTALPSHVRGEIRRAADVRDWWPYARSTAVKILGDIGDRADLPVLREIALRDTTHSTRHGEVLYEVRKQAESAIARICRKTGPSPECAEPKSQ